MDDLTDQTFALSPASAIPPALPPTVEEAYRRKCNKLRQRTNEVEKANDASRVRINRLKRQIEKLRLERVFLFEQLAKRTSTNVEDSDGSPSPPPTVSSSPSSLSPRRLLLNAAALSNNPSQNERDDRLTPSRLDKQPKEKPLRLKRGHRKASILPVDGSGSQAGGSQAGGNGVGPSSLTASQFISQNPEGASHSPSGSDAFSLANRGGSNGVHHQEPPKKPGNAFELYCNERNTAASADVATDDKAEQEESRREVDDDELARGWKDLSETQRGEFETRAGENMAQYEKERGEYDDAAAAAEAKRQKESEEAEEKGKENGTENATEEEQKDDQGDVEMGEYDTDQETQPNPEDD
ncbi:uncharacterized protein PODANS_7_7190 [Podospora anserina S mat+]|uniref:Podospora anserina S mat+ genomic DNA chromosome 7, supercontig 1 n=1 Tax=Podospora anserina (strain S / ATCC MYA-4624 / DSM 980 / FGSC 10383) TaxID=515849 RepID=B2AWH5_PODAN|nr:uncharacterized protein PODANS_7_7190 [Podospora anserina S mat+]CAP68749.1 unnamed protein product [Podospora anserina S mat+]CDP32219.1 Putative protein of unknown function [Podospora anserina S mat+]